MGEIKARQGSSSECEYVHISIKVAIVSPRSIFMGPAVLINGPYASMLTKTLIIDLLLPYIARKIQSFL